jgi:DNA mismatch repair protein MutH
MTQAKYDKTSVESILKFAQLLTGRTLDEVVTLPNSVANSRNKGDLGGLVEAHFFELPPSTRGIDFPEAGLELKTTGLLQRRDGTFKAKERLVLTMINYVNIVDEEWESSVFFLKCRLMLILFYLYDREVPSIYQRFVLSPILYKMIENDEAVIRKDWEFIRDKVRQGKAHEISEGDTYYLGACRKGAGGADEALRAQPFSDLGAKARAFSFKPSYVNVLISGQAALSSGLDKALEVTFEEATEARFRPFIGLTITELSKKLDCFRTSPGQNGFFRQLAVKILSRSDQTIPELEKAGIEMKTIRLNARGRPREAMSFPGFKYLEIVDQEWEESSFFEKLESRFLFVVFQEDESGVERLQRVTYWNMPYQDRLEAQRVWEDTKRRVQIDASDLPRTRESRVAHVRPKAANAKDTIPTPQGTMLVKKCFWLNSSYIAEVLSSDLRTA